MTHIKTWRTDLDNMVYIIRDEGTLPLSRFISKYGYEVVSEAQKNLLSNLVDMAGNIFPNASIKVVSAQEQIDRANKVLSNTNTISLDTYFKGTYNLEVTRLFKMVNGETEFIRLTNRPGTDDIETQIHKILPGTYTLVDDDAVGVRTIKSVMSMLPSDVKVDNTYLLMNDCRNSEEQPVLDVVDCRDFITGCQGIGLTVLHKELGKIRVPYMLPFVDINDKANIPDGQEIEVSKMLWDFVKQFWNTMNSDAKLMDAGEDFIRLSKTFGIREDTPMSEVCSRYKEMAQRGILI